VFASKICSYLNARTASTGLAQICIVLSFGQQDSSLSVASLLNARASQLRVRESEDEYAIGDVTGDPY